MTLTFTKAEKKKAKLRLALFGPSGSGKTFTGLRIATGMAGRIAVIDTENESASKYADRFTFDTLNLQNKSIDGVCEAFQAAATQKFDIVIIDSLSHAWQELLDEVDALAASKFRGNSHAAWSYGTPKQRQLVRAILDCPFHLIGTMRSKTLWTAEEINGKKKPVKIGLAPEQGKGIEYEFDMLMEIDFEHRATIGKDRTGKYQDKVILKPGEELGKDLIAWLNSGVETITKAQGDELRELGTKKSIMGAALLEFLGVTRLGELTTTRFAEVKKRLEAYEPPVEQKDVDRQAEVLAQMNLGFGLNDVYDYVDTLPFAADLRSVAGHLRTLADEKTDAELKAIFSKSTAAA